MTIPPLERLGVDTGGLDKLLSKLETFATERAEAEYRINGAEAELEDARRLDDEAYAKAIRAGKTPPEQGHLKEAEEKIKELERRARGLEKVVEELTAEAKQHILSHTGEWKAKVEAQVPAASSRYEKAVEELAAARENYSATASAAAWMDNPHGKYLPRGGESPVRLGLENMAPGVHYSGTPQEVMVGPVLSAMRHEAKLHERQRAKEGASRVHMMSGHPQVPADREAG